MSVAKKIIIFVKCVVKSLALAMGFYDTSIEFTKVNHVRPYTHTDGSRLTVQ